MSGKLRESLGTIRFEGQLLPAWAQLLDLAARLTAVNEEAHRWFSKLTNSTGVDDARTVFAHCFALQAGLRQQKETILTELRREKGDVQPSQIYAAWVYAVDTMILEARGKKSCSWTVESSSEPSRVSVEARRLTQIFAAQSTLDLLLRT
jgi:hypothetical protein